MRILMRHMTLWQLTKWAFTNEGGFGGGQKAKPMTPPPDPAQESDKDVQEAKAARKRQATAARGYSKTIATSPMGVPGEQQTGQATKLG